MREQPYQCIDKLPEQLSLNFPRMEAMQQAMDQCGEAGDVYKRQSLDHQQLNFPLQNLLFLEMERASFVPIQDKECCNEIFKEV